MRIEQKRPKNDPKQEASYAETGLDRNDLKVRKKGFVTKDRPSGPFWTF